MCLIPIIKYNKSSFYLKQVYWTSLTIAIMKLIRHMTFCHRKCLDWSNSECQKHHPHILLKQEAKSHDTIEL